MSHQWGSHRDHPYPPNQGFGGRNNRQQHGGGGRGGGGAGRRYNDRAGRNDDYYGGRHNNNNRYDRGSNRNDERARDRYGPRGNDNGRNDYHQNGRDHSYYGQASRPDAHSSASMSNQQQQNERRPNVDPRRQTNGNGGEPRPDPMPSSMNMDTVNATVYPDAQTSSGNVPPASLSSATMNADSGATTNEQTSDDNAPEPKKAFADMGYKEQLEEQIPHSEADKAAFIRKLPAESLTPKTPSGKKPHTGLWKDHKENLARNLVEQMKATWPQIASAAQEDVPLDGYTTDEMMEMDDDATKPGVSMAQDGPRDPVLFGQLERFILALPTCHLMSIGFDYSGTAGEEMCICPCHDQQTWQWRKLAGAEIKGGERDECGECSNNKKNKKKRFDAPNALVAHLEQMAESCVFHKYTLLYLEELYANWNSSGLKHKGLYIVGTKNYREAVALEQKQRDRVLLHEMSEWDEKQEKLRKELKALAKTNASLVETYKEMLGDREEIMKKLGMDTFAPSNWVAPSAEEMLPKDKRKFKRFIDNIQKRFNLEGVQSTSRIIKVEQRFSLNELFEWWSDPECNDFASILFRDLKGAADVSELLSTWKIKYKVHEHVKGASKEVRRSFEAQDAGGPLKQFFSDLWQQLPSLEVTPPDSEIGFKLFDTAAGSHYPTYFPRADAEFENAFAESEEACMWAKNKAKLYYRAFGRLFLHCICREQLIPRQVLPQLLCNVILRDCLPSDPDYCPLDLAVHLLDFGMNKTTLDYYANEKSPKEFREEIQTNSIYGRSVWLDSFMDGVTATTVSTVANGSTKETRVPLSDFSSIALENIERLIFATHEFSAEELFRTLSPEYSNDDILRPSQERLFNTSLKGVLEKWGASDDDRERLHWFVKFCTGQTYLNTDPHSAFRITVAFEQNTVDGNSNSNDRLPEVHTCDARLSFPVTAYNGDCELLEAKLKEAVDSCHKFFTMH